MLVFKNIDKYNEDHRGAEAQLNLKTLKILFCFL